MSTSSIYSSLPASTQAALATSTSSSSPLQITGLASGLNTQQIVQQLVYLAAAPVVNLTSQQTSLQALNAQLTSIQTNLQGVGLNAQSLGDPTLFDGSQSVASSNTNIVTATMGNSGGAGIGGYQLSVSQLANSAQRTFSFTSPSADGTMTIDGQSVAVTAGESQQSFLKSINSNSNLDVYAATTSNGTVVLSNRSTGDTGTNFIQVSDPTGTMVEQTALAKEGKDAQFSVDGVSGSSSTNTVTNAIAGVSLSLNGVTTGSYPVTITVQPPGPNVANITSAVNAFVQSYNSSISQIQTQLSTAPATGTSNSSSLFGDPEMLSLLSNMRSTNYTPAAGLPAGMASLADIGISTGAASGAGPTSAGALAGQLTVNQTTLANAIANNPQGVQAILQAWSQSFQNVVNNEAAAGGAIDTRMQGDTTTISQLSDQIDQQNAMLVIKQQSLTQQYAALEVALSNAQTQGSWLTGQTAALSANSAAIATSSSH